MRTAALLAAAFLLAAAVWYAPEKAADLGSLLPVETLVVTRENGTVTVTGGGLRGTGPDWAGAMEDLEASAPGTVFLKTTDRVILAEDAADCLEAVRADERLRPAVQLFWLRGSAGPALEDFAAAQESGVTVGRGGTLPVIREEDGRYRLA